jgi:hypothetical protein
MGKSQAVQTLDVVDFHTDQRLSRGTRAFLKALNTPAPPELEKLAPVAARKVLETEGALGIGRCKNVEAVPEQASASGCGRPRSRGSRPRLSGVGCDVRATP